MNELIYIFLCYLRIVVFIFLLEMSAIAKLDIKAFLCATLRPSFLPDLLCLIAKPLQSLSCQLAFQIEDSWNQVFLSVQ